MKKITKSVLATLFSVLLTACAASSTSPIGVNCDFSQGKPLSEMPLACQGR